ncbi:MAG: hypothetical protein WKF86_11645 [Acidimicrobiales bacterium]
MRDPWAGLAGAVTIIADAQLAGAAAARASCSARSGAGHTAHGGATWGDSEQWLPALPADSVDLFFTSPPYADARAYSRINPDRYVDWFLPYSKAMLAATKPSGWFVLNIKNRVAKSGPLTGQRHPYVRPRLPPQDRRRGALSVSGQQPGLGRGRQGTTSSSPRALVRGGGA